MASFGKQNLLELITGLRSKHALEADDATAAAAAEAKAEAAAARAVAKAAAAAEAKAQKEPAKMNPQKKAKVQAQEVDQDHSVQRLMSKTTPKRWLHQNKKRRRNQL